MSKFYAVSQIVPDYILEATKDICDKSNCNRVFRYNGGTMLGHTCYYDNKNKLHYNDPNRLSYAMSCSMCWRIWNIVKQLDSDGGEVSVKEGEK